MNNQDNRKSRKLTEPEETDESYTDKSINKLPEKKLRSPLKKSYYYDKENSRERERAYRGYRVTGHNNSTWQGYTEE